MTSSIQKLSFELDKGAGERARIGVLVLESDQSIEWELGQITQIEGVAIYHSRLENSPIVTEESLAMMEKQLPIAAKLLPQYLNLNSIGYGCTSASNVIGEDKVRAILNECHPNVPSTNPLSAVKAAFKTLNINKIALLTPYSPEVTTSLQVELSQSGIDVTLIGSYYEENDEMVGRISSDSILESIIHLGSNENCDGVFVSCTSLRALHIIQKAEEIIGKPVTSSNHAFAWHLLRLAGIDDLLEGYGKLYEHCL